MFKFGFKQSFSLTQQPKRLFNSKKPKASEGQVDKVRHINQSQLKFQNLIRKEVIPIGFLSLGIAFAYQFKTEIENYFSFLTSEVISAKDER